MLPSRPWGRRLGQDLVSEQQQRDGQENQLQAHSGSLAEGLGPWLEPASAPASSSAEARPRAAGVSACR